MADKTSDNAKNTIDIATNGDVILVVGNEESEKIRLRVDSYFLQSASPVFKAMLGPNFTEGQQLHAAKSLNNASNHQNTVAEVKLPDDNPLAMKMLCQLMHGKIKDIEVKPDADLVLKIATTADKYFLNTLTGWNLAPFLSITEDQDIDTLAKLVVGAMYFDDAWSFESITQKMILDHKCAFDELAYPSLVNKANLWQMIHFLAAMRSYEQNDLIHELWAVIPALIKPYDPCRCAPDYEHTLRDRKVEIRSSLQHSLSSLKKVVSDLMTNSNNIGTCSKRGYHLSEADFRNKIMVVSEKITKIRGLCLDCVKNGRKDKIDDLCRFHPN